MLSYLFLVRRAADGVYLVWLIFLSSWAAIPARTVQVCCLDAISLLRLKP